MNRDVRQLCARMSLRQPQARSLEILAEVLERVELGKDADLAGQLGAIQVAFPHVEDFEREFASLCFALATGVGKTRLMGAFIAHLYLTGRSRHFFVLAPNLTIYEKLKADFDPASPKYVFKGVQQLALHPPLLITGENYETGIGVRAENLAPETATPQLFGAATSLQINIFNISKINADVKGADRSGKPPRIKRLQEYIGESYFAYLAGLDDLVVLMDEAHRYRASAGARAIGELRPLLGLELTATPKTIGARPQPFRNVIYGYGLGKALADGLVKEPAVATRKDFDPSSVPADELERIKLEDGIRYHEYVKVELETYARQAGVARIKPFVLVVAQDTAHASRARDLMESDGFFDGRYRGRVIEVHSALRGEESDEATQRLLAVERDETTEVVIHVNKLKEGWDVSNLYTIVPLRASASEILTEQTLGRGLRLPYGKRTGVAAVDRLTIVAHDRFREIIDRAGATDAVIRERVYIGNGGDVPEQAPQAAQAQPLSYSVLTGDSSRLGSTYFASEIAEEAAEYRISSPGDQEIARETLRVVQRYERLPSLAQLNTEDVRAKVAAEVTAVLQPRQAPLAIDSGAEGFDDRVARVVERVTRAVVELTIEIPNVVLIPTRDVSFGFGDFDLEHLSRIAYPAVSEQLVVQQLRDHARELIGWSKHEGRELRLEDYIVAKLIERDEIDYDAHAGLLYKLSGQIVAHLRSYLPEEAAVENVLIYYRRQLAEFVWAQMERHLWETPTDYVPRITRGFSLLRPLAFSLPAGQTPRPFRQSLVRGENIRSLVFSGFRKCCYDLQRFQSAEGEQRLAIVLEDDRDVRRWMKPGPGQFQIEWKHGRAYEPDFVVETDAEKLILEPKARGDVGDPDVQAKALAAARWCAHATEHAQSNGGKPWRYALIPHDAMEGGSTARGLADRYRVGAAQE
ncbi:DEAD/DEAH box helicase [Xanthomonas graminis]|uniref:DEAD/DEAH box helicase n=1 Tax=Xanthomonas graminis TaxID=3390026 RepID=UPI001F1AF40F|nr:DEAD/DEAH box helicase family protein [Xanthomonas translucens]UKE72972.1 DEAD/DEAH box helicase family protein [Xanthomonas translucens pv. phleipratensis]